MRSLPPAPTAPRGIWRGSEGRFGLWLAGAAAWALVGASALFTLAVFAWGLRAIAAVLGRRLGW